MANFAILDKNNVVVDVVTMPDSYESNGEVVLQEISGKVHKRTSYNTSKGKRSDGRKGKIPFRGNYAGIGYTYHADIDCFVPPKPFPSWVLDVGTATYVAPKPRPNDNNVYDWDESRQQWVLSSPGMTRND